MAVSKHNLWKRKKNGLMKLVRSHQDWLQRRRDAKMRILNGRRITTTENKQWWENDNKQPDMSYKDKYDGLTGKESSTKRTQVGKKV